MAKSKKENSRQRPPVVVILGHVDHGKTRLLDTIRRTNVTAGETGGITQHIGAYKAKVKDGENKERAITFLDTPGHEAFHQMRLRGARVADVAVLVVAADEGVKPQTEEAIRHIKEAEIPFVVTLNKMDKPGADPNRVKQELAEREIFVEGWGGDVPVAEISALKGDGLPEFLEIILLIAALEELTADLSSPAEGVVIESFLDSQRGPSATLLLRRGILKVSDWIWSGDTYGKIKIMENFKGEEVPQARPSDPVLVIGLKDVPTVGEKFGRVDGETEAAAEAKRYREEVSKRDRLAVEEDKNGVGEEKEKESEADDRVNEGNAEVSQEEAEAERPVLTLVIKADVKGSIEAIVETLAALSQDKIKIQILKAAPGEVNENDIKLVEAGNALLLAFRVSYPATLDILVRQSNVSVERFDIIYELVERVRKRMEELEGAIEIKEEELGRLEVLAVFLTEKGRMVVGGKVRSGYIRKGSRVEVLRKEGGDEEAVQVGWGRASEIKKVKESVEKVEKGNEAGVSFDGNVKIKTGDILVFYGKPDR